MENLIDINPVNVVNALLVRVKEEFPDFPVSTDVNCKENLLVNKLFKHFHTVLTDAVFEEQDELFMDESQQSQVSSYSPNSLTDDSGQIVEEVRSDGVTLERKKEILELVRLNKDWKLKTLQRHGAKELKYMSYVSRWQEQVRSGGSRFEKLKFIDAHTYKKFCEAREGFKSVRDINLQTWALQAFQTFVNPNFPFTASRRWATSFKHRHGISSRKVTKLVSRRGLINMDQVRESARIFQEEIKTLAASYPPHLTFNTDQTGFSYEITAKRTLSFKGERSTFAVAKSPKNLATHSYTVQYVISKAGNILPSVFVCLQETKGKLGPQVQEGLFCAPNVTISCSSSGKLTTSIYEYFLEKNVANYMNENFLWIVDSWSGQTNPISYQNVFGEKDYSCAVRIIPKNCTEIVQPLDTTFHLQLKYFADKVYREFTLNYTEDINPSDEITVRNNIIRTQSLLHNQLSAPKFKDMVKYCWYSSGLTDEHPSFLTVKQVCFSFGSNESVECSNECCKNLRFLKCAYCKKNFCFPCFYYSYHFHF